MTWLQVKVDTKPDHAGLVEEALTAAGALSVTLEDAGDTPLLEPAPGAMPLWHATRVVALFGATVDRDRVTDSLALAADGAELTPVFETLPDREWSRAWMDDWQPLRFGRRLWVAPLEAELDEPGAVVLRLDPGLAFGTGTHATTALCLEWLDARELSGATVLDYGCGSGILAIAALKLGAIQAHGVDVDPQALEATGSNAVTNGVADRITTSQPDDPMTGPFDFVVANILAGPLMQCAETIARLQEPGGRIALAGVLAEQADDVIAAYERWYHLEIGTERDEWVRIEGTRHNGQ
ncbi:MAG: 50S ribosomal protein L11 methyltransferase [Halofilum sp. (in: g-proteobacteria)]